MMRAENEDERIDRLAADVLARMGLEFDVTVNRIREVCPLCPWTSGWIGMSDPIRLIMDLARDHARTHIEGIT